MSRLRPLLLLPFAIVVVAIVAALQFRPEGGLADPEKSGYPNSIAAVGDSITRATNSDAFGDQPHNSWSTGTSSSVQSFYYRILQENPAISGNNYNDAVAGAKMVNLDGQVTTVNSRGVDLVTILMGANDVCTGSEATMTPVATYRAQFEQALATLSAGSPDVWPVDFNDDQIADLEDVVFAFITSLLPDGLDQPVVPGLERMNFVEDGFINLDDVILGFIIKLLPTGLDTPCTP